MSNIAGRYEKKQAKIWDGLYFLIVPMSFFLIEAFGFDFLALEEEVDNRTYWQLAFGGLWAALLSGLIMILPGKAGRVAYGISYLLSLIYAGFQTGYYILFSEMMWISDFRYASEGSDYISVLLSYPAGWYLWIIGLICLGVLSVWKFPVWTFSIGRTIAGAVVTAAAVLAASLLPQLVFVHDKEIRYAGSDYGRAQSAEAAYNNMFNTYRLYQVCGIYQTAVKDIYANVPEAEGKIVSIIDACCNEIAAAGEREVFLIASEGTIQSGVFAEGLKPHGIAVHSPENEQFLMQRELIEAVKQDQITPEVVERFIELVKSFSGDALILGCTEFPVLFSKVPEGTFGNIRIYDPLECVLRVLQKECK